MHVRSSHFTSIAVFANMNHVSRSASRFYHHYIIFYVATLVFFSIGAITSLNIGWYRSIILPAFMPPEVAIAVIWGILIFLAVLSLSLFWDVHSKDRKFHTTIALYSANAIVILVWNYVFFGLHDLGLASLASVIVGMSVLSIILHIWRISRSSALLLTPYLAWVAFAMYLNHTLALLNPGM
ncbi:MAG: TspO protein [Parcubacteria group bacterium]|nr:TspO protein [Parcubacteria group bacterium]